jgi:hypothetical protein
MILFLPYLFVCLEIYEKCEDKTYFNLKKNYNEAWKSADLIPRYCAEYAEFPEQCFFTDFLRTGLDDKTTAKEACCACRFGGRNLNFDQYICLNIIKKFIVRKNKKKKKTNFSYRHFMLRLDKRKSEKNQILFFYYLIINFMKIDLFIVINI